MQFFPDFAKQFTEHVFVEVDGRAARCAVTATGVGLGPSAIFSYDILDVGNTFIHTTYHYNVTLENRGEVPVPFSVVSGSGPLAQAFSMEPSSGIVAVDASLQLNVKLLADRLGKFEERMFLHVSGTDKPLQVQFKGRVVGPTYSVNVKQLDYGVVAYGFRCVLHTAERAENLTRYLHCAVSLSWFHGTSHKADEYLAMQQLVMMIQVPPGQQGVLMQLHKGLHTHQHE
jgi:hydrocephalus-inducing protein